MLISAQFQLSAQEDRTNTAKSPINSLVAVTVRQLYTVSIVLSGARSERFAYSTNTFNVISQSK